MTSLLCKVEGLYQTSVGNDQKKYTPFEFEIEVVGGHRRFLDSDLKNRYIPMEIRKNKDLPRFDRIKEYNLTSVREINIGEPCYLLGKDILKMNEKELQDMARLLNLLEIPLPGKATIWNMREQAVLGYLGQVLKIPVKTPKDKDKWDFFIKQPDGTYKIEFNEGEGLQMIKDENYYNPPKKDISKKMSLSDIVGYDVSKTSVDTSQNNQVDDENLNQDFGLSEDILDEDLLSTGDELEGQGQQSLDSINQAQIDGNENKNMFSSIGNFFGR